MSRPRTPDPAKLFLSAIYSSGEALEACLPELIRKFGPTDHSTRELPFAMTHYYDGEMGGKLLRRFFTFKEPVDPGELPAIKLFTNSLEEGQREGDLRRINLDPGLISVYNFVLATGKPNPSRTYAGRGIYIDLTLVFESGSFKRLEWTYPDYAEDEMIAFLNRIREAYKHDLRRRAKERKTN